jgi:hypothetical protein
MSFVSLVAESADNANLIWVVDLWTSEEEHAEALKMRPFVGDCMPLLESMPEEIKVLPIGGKHRVAEPAEERPRRPSLVGSEGSDVSSW